MTGRPCREKHLGFGPSECLLCELPDGADNICAIKIQAEALTCGSTKETNHPSWGKGSVNAAGGFEAEHELRGGAEWLNLWEGETQLK